MLQPILHKLRLKTVVLASGSPRRKQILNLLNIPYKVRVSDFEENLNKEDYDKPYLYAMENAKQKALSVAKILAAEDQSADLIIGADTVVFFNNKIFEKPKSTSEAVLMLTLLNGKSHHVYTGVALISKKSESDFITTTFYEKTEVTMGTLSPEVIESYVATGEPMDKAGGYGIQALGASLIKGIQGDYYNVEGFPLHSFCCHVCKIFSSETQTRDLSLNDPIAK